MDDVIAGYRVVSEPSNANGGKCMWAFAEKDGQQYFLKQFLEPKRPREGSPGSAASRRIRLEVCAEFESRNQAIKERLRPDARGAGNLVLATDFFCEGSTYYKVTKRIDTSTLEKPQSLDPRKKRVLLRTLGLSLRLLHDIGVVHGDLKPLNVLVQKKEGSAFHVAKLIDFDDSYLSGKPPGRQEIAGDSVYGAPEWRRYVQEDESVRSQHLTTAVDVFALGLMAHYYLTGAIPAHDARYGSPADALNAGEQLLIDERLSDSMKGLVRVMTAATPARRPGVATFLNVLKDQEVCALRRKRPSSSGKRASGTSPRPGSESASAGTEASPRKSRIRANLTGGGESRPDRSTASRPPTPPAPTSPTASEPTEPTASEPTEPTAPVVTPTEESATASPTPSRVRINLGDRRRS